MSIKKIVAAFITLLVMNIPFILFGKEVYTSINFLIPFVFFNLFTFADISIRPISEKKDRYKYPNLLYIVILFFPLITFLPYFEYKFLISAYFPILNSVLINIIGTGILFIGGIILIASRITIGKFGSQKIVIEDKHQFVHSGFYKYIRHPIYLGFILLFAGYYLSFYSYIFSLLISVIFFLIFRSRMIVEEKLLLEKFGDEYKNYMGKTKRLIPGIY